MCSNMSRNHDAHIQAEYKVMELSEMAVLVCIWKMRYFLTSKLSLWYSLKHPAGQSDTGFSSTMEQDVENVKKKLEHQLFV